MSEIIIPAHNEEGLIHGTLTSLVDSDFSGPVIVVCNGCIDNTLIIAKKFEPRVTVLEVETPSKTNAINLGEEHASSFPRIYVDADVELTEGSLEKIIKALEKGTHLAVSPIPKMNLENANWFVKAYYEIWLSLPYSQQGLMGSGVYALSEEGRQRFGKFPDIIADDGYVRALFKEHERCNVEGAYSVVTAPANLHWLIKIKTRSRMGQWQLAHLYPELLSNEEKNYSSAIFDIFINPKLWPKVAVYLYVNIVSRILAKRKMNDLASYCWEKDVSSRVKSDN